ncbi:hypothetical protein ACFSQJ_08740 [Croceitalea marina]|uniref:Cardiolipin synthase N-terminal domain-containing protein n=1 Tax=Croceitalea marina TaxID=1775166 RepID=A0ABW5MW49_9FLAO
MLNSKFWQAFFALTPIIVFFGFFIVYFLFIFSIFSNIEDFEANGNISTSLIFGNIIWFFAFIILTILISFGSLIFYIVHAVQNPNLKENNLLVVWVLLFVFVSGIGQLIYWLVEIVGKRKSLTT